MRGTYVYRYHIFGLICTGIICFTIILQEMQPKFGSPYIHFKFRGPIPRTGGPNSSLNASILCMVLTTHEHILTKAKAVEETWGRRCNKTVFFTNQMIKKPNVVYLDTVQDGRQHLTEKVMKSFEYVHKHFGGHDWYLKADDDTYVIVDNLRKLLTYFNHREPVYLGQNFKYFTKQGYNSGGAGYVLSYKALDIMLRGVDHNKCTKDGNDEDVDIGICLDSLGVQAYDTTDKFERETFHASTLVDHVVGPFSDLLKNYPSRPAKLGRECCSSLSVSFHYVPPKLMYVIDMLLYHLTVFGRDYHKNLDIFDSNFK